MAIIRLDPVPSRPPARRALSWASFLTGVVRLGGELLALWRRLDYPGLGP